MTTTEDQVLQVSDQFYQALNKLLNGDPGPMSDVWSHASDVTTMHPLGGREVGWDEVWKVWSQASQVFSEGEVTFSDLLVRIAGDFAYTIGKEHVEANLSGSPITEDVRATNIYRQEEDGWKMVHHHTDVAPSMQPPA